MAHFALVVEDDEDLATIFSEALKAAGYTTEIIRDGAQAQQKLKDVVPNLVILDMHLPRVDGATLLAQIRADERLQKTTVLVATADAQMGDFYRDVADFVLIKPISFSQLRDLTIRIGQQL